MQNSKKITRRSILASSTGVLGISTLSGASVAANRGQPSQATPKGLSIKELPDAITVADGEAKVKGWARSSNKGNVSVRTSTGTSITYTASDFAEDINRAVEMGFLLVRNGRSGLEFDLTARGRQLIGGVDDTPFETQDHCDGKNKIQGDTIYLDDGSVDEILIGGALSGGVFTLAGTIVGLLTAATLGPIVFAAAGILLGLSATGLSAMNDGCGIKIDTGSNSVSSQHCDC